MHEISWHRSGTGGNWFEHLGFSLRFEREKRLALWKAGFFYRTFNPWVVGSIPTGPTQAIQGKVRANVRFVPKTLQIDSQFVVVDRGGDGRLCKTKPVKEGH